VPTHRAYDVTLVGGTEEGVAKDELGDEVAAAEHVPTIVAMVIMADGGTLEIAAPTGTCK